MEDIKGKDDEYLSLTKPEEWDINFLKKDRIDFIKDCLPQYNKIMARLLNKSFDFIYNSGPEITDNDLPAFSLDSGRIVTDPYNLDLKPMLWEV